MTQISKINSAVLTVYATDANMCINVKGNVTGELTMANEKRLIDANAQISTGTARQSCSSLWISEREIRMLTRGIRSENDV